MYCLRRFIPALVMVAVVHLVQGQHRRTFTREVSFITDNDNYTLQKRDGYYTNGFNFAFQHISIPHSPRTQKAIMRYEIGQMIFNPYKYSVTDPEFMDRPFAGYLFAKVTRSRFFKNDANLRYGIMVGVLGPASGAQAVQRKYHNLINIYEVRGWDYQLKSEASANLQAQYSHPLAGRPAKGVAADLHAVTSGSLGNAFTNATMGVLFRVGFIEHAEESVQWNSRLHHSGPTYLHKHEFFLFFKPEAMFQAYNATLQGGLFREDKGPVLAELNPWMYQHRIGMMYAGRSLSASFAIVHRTREAKHMYRKENYGSIGIALRVK